MAQRRPLMTSKPKYVNDSDNDEDDEDQDLESGEFDEVMEGDLNELREKRKRRLELQRIEDAQYEGEWGYALIKALRGKTVGRRIRRKLFKFGMFQLICGFALMMIGINEVRNFKNNEYMDNTKYGGSLMVGKSRSCFCVSIYCSLVLALLVYPPSFIIHHRI